MKKIVIIILFIFSINPGKSQDTIKSWIDDWQKSTVSIGKIDTAKFKNKKIPYFSIVGTGVIFYVKYDTILIPTLVTAKHVFQDVNLNWFPTEIWIRFSWFDDKRVDQYLGIRIPLEENRVKKWFAHPNINVDLASLPLVINKDIKIGNNNTIPVLPYNQIASKLDIYEGESILVFGYPGAVGSDFNTKAIIRQGIVAWTPSTFTPTSKILIDCDVFPGNSGGPVFTYPIGLSRDGSFNLGGKIKFIGIVVERRKSETEVFSASNPDSPLKDNKGKPILSFESIGIGVVEPSMRIKELLDFTQKSIK